jgi:hypothetical protein
MPMPYTLAKGTILAVLEDLANPSTPSEHARLVTNLQKLRNGDPLTTISMSGFPSPAGLAPLVDRLELNWFGKRPDGAGGYLPQPPFSATNTRTGYFKRYYGDVEGILRETLIRTIEVAFGIDHDASLDTATRQWPVEMMWKCPNPWFEGWVTWRRHGPNPADGQVTVILASPAEDANPVINVAALPPGFAAPLPDPTTLPPDHHGMWLVTHEKHVKHNVDALTELPEQSYLDNLIDGVRALVGLAPGTWSIPLPSTTWEGTGVVDVVHIPESAGGAAPYGATYSS